MERAVTNSMPMTLGNSDADAELVERYLAGDMAAFDELMIRYERQVYRVCYRFVENQDDAKDLAQEVFIKAFEHLGTFRRESSLKTWLYRIAMNHCINHVKKHSPEFVEVSETIGSVGATVIHNWKTASNGIISDGWSSSCRRNKKRSLKCASMSSSAMRK